MRFSIVIVVSVFAAFNAGAACAGDAMTEDQCVKDFLDKPVKDWKGYDLCRRGATQLKLKGADGLTNRGLMLPQTNVPAAGGPGTNGDPNVH